LSHYTQATRGGEAAVEALAAAFATQNPVPILQVP
jgi:hypothetical protein